MHAKSLPPQIHRTLLSIPHTSFPYGFLPYLPAKAILKDGSIEPRIVFFGTNAYRRIWGPSHDRRFVTVDEVIGVDQSDSQLLPRFAEQLYAGGENTSGGTYFSVTMNDGKTFYYSSGGLLDFIKYPEGYGKHDVVSVNKGIPLELRKKLGSRIVESVKYAWCLYDEPKGILNRVRKESPRL